MDELLLCFFFFFFFFFFQAEDGIRDVAVTGVQTCALPISGDRRLRAAAQLPIEVQTSFALLLTMTSRGDKLWPEAHWRSLGSALEAGGMQCLLPGGAAAKKNPPQPIPATRLPVPQLLLLLFFF